VEQKSLPPLGITLGAVVVVLAAFGFFAASLVLGGARDVERATLVPPASQPLAATEPVAQGPAATPMPTLTPPPDPEAPVPTRVVAQIPQVASDFTLDQAKGEPVNLFEQLKEGPVVLVLMQSGGG
jgi:hypothetical protein